MPISQPTCTHRCGALLTAAALSTAAQGLAFAGSPEGPPAKPAETSAAHDRLYLCVSSREPQRQLIMQVDTAKGRMHAQATKEDSALPRGVGSGSIKQDGLNWRQRQGATSAHRELRLDGELYHCEATHRD